MLNPIEDGGGENMVSRAQGGGTQAENINNLKQGSKLLCLMFEDIHDGWGTVSKNPTLRLKDFLSQI